METNKIVAAIFAATVDKTTWSGPESFLTHYDQMLAMLDARDEAKRVARADVVLPEAERA